MSNERDTPTLRGIKQIAHAMNVSERTAKRMHAKGLLPGVRKAGCGGRTSRLEMPADAVRKSEREG